MRDTRLVVVKVKGSTSDYISLVNFVLLWVMTANNEAVIKDEDKKSRYRVCLTGMMPFRTRTVKHRLTNGIVFAFSMCEF